MPSDSYPNIVLNAFVDVLRAEVPWDRCADLGVRVLKELERHGWRVVPIADAPVFDLPRGDSRTVKGQVR